jgi:hypothetical protein
MLLPKFLLKNKFLLGWFHKVWRTPLEILFLGFSGLFSVFDLVKVSFLFRATFKLRFVALFFVSDVGLFGWFLSFPQLRALAKNFGKRNNFKNFSYVVTHCAWRFVNKF